MENKIMKIRWFKKRENKITYDLITEIFPDGSFGTIEDSEWTIFAGIYTWILDKNEKEIYEHDIVRLDGRNYEVYWKYDCWGLEDGHKEDYDNGDYYYGDRIRWKEAVVIGNKFENPDLLE